MKKWPSAGGGGSLLLYIDTPLVPGRVVNRDKRGAFCHGWWDHPRLKGDFAREPQKGKFPSLVPGGVERPIRRTRDELDFQLMSPTELPKLVKTTLPLECY
jgi:hypothetical protein